MNRKQHFIYLAIFVLLTFGTSQLVFRFYQVRRAEALQQSLMNEVSTLAQDIQLHLTDSLTALNTMESILVLQDYTTDDFDFWGRVILDGSPGVSAVQLAPGGVVRHIVPIEGNEGALGHDLLSDSRRESGAQQAIANREITFVGPLRLIQNDRMAVIARKPVFRESASGEAFWGFVIILIEIDNLVRSDREVASEFPVAWHLLGYDPDKNEETEHPLIAASPNAEHVERWDISYDIAVPNGRWRMEVAFVDPSKPDLVIGQALVLAITAVLSTIFLLQQLQVTRRNEELAQSEARYRLLAENATDVIWVLNVDRMEFTYVSPSVYTLRGYTAEEAMRQDLSRSMTPESTEYALQRISESVVRFRQDPVGFSQQISYNEFQLPCKDGRVIWSEATTRYRLNEEGEIEIIGISRSIEERKRQQRRLENRLRYDHNIAEFASHLLVTHPHELDTCLRYLVDTAQCSRVRVFENFIDSEGRLAFRMKHEACATGFAPQPAADPLPHFVYDTDGFARWKEKFSQNAVVGGIVSTFPESERVVLEAHGIKSIVAIPIRIRDDWYGFIGFDENVRQKAWSTEDIALLRTASNILGMYFERSRVEQSLAESEARFRLAFENANDGICLVAPDGRFLQVNQRMSDIFGYAKSELESLTVTDITHPEDTEISPRFINRSIGGEAARSVFEKRYIRKDGRVIWGQVSSSLVRDDRGQPLHFISHVQDISDRKEIDRVKEDVDRIMRHDLRNPLSGILGLPQILLGEGNLTEDQVAMVSAIEEAGLNMLHMIDLSLDLFKMETGSFTFTPEPVDIIGVLATLVEQKRALMISLGLKVDATVDGRPFSPAARLPVQSQNHLLYSMLSNLLTNAIEAAPTGSVIEIRVRNAESISVGIRNKGAVPQEIRATFFEKYSTYGKRRGTGLGTYSAKLIADNMGYAIEMRASDEDDTTEVTVTIPQTSTRSSDE